MLTWVGSSILLDMVASGLLSGGDGGVEERIEIAQLRGRRQINPAIDDERDFLFGQPAMAAKRLFQRRKIMPVFGSADGHVFIGDNDDIADPVRGQIEPADRVLLVDGKHDAVNFLIRLMISCRRALSGR